MEKLVLINACVYSKCTGHPTKLPNVVAYAGVNLHGIQLNDASNYDPIYFLVNCSYYLAILNLFWKIDLTESTTF